MEMTIKELGNFEYNQEHGGNIPADVKKLNGATVRMRGFMIPMDQSDTISRFALVPSLWSCCFGEPPQVQHIITVHCEKGKGVSYVSRPIVVEGLLEVKETREDGYVVGLFNLTCRSVQAEKEIQ